MIGLRKVATFFIVATCILIAASPEFVKAQADESAQSNDELDQSVYRILVPFEGGLGTGTGFLVTHDNHVLTNQHVIDAADKIYVGFADGGKTYTSIPARVVWSSKKLDLAVLRTNQDLPGKPLAFAADVPQGFPAKGLPVSAIGFPGDADIFTDPSGLDVRDFNSTITVGVVSRVFEADVDQGERWSIQHTAEISPGNSGGPLFDRCQTVLGINTLGSNDILISTHSSVAVDALRSQNIPILVRDTPCVKAENQSPFPTHWFYLLLIGLAFCVALFLFARKSREGHAATVIVRDDESTDGGDFRPEPLLDEEEGWILREDEEFSHVDEVPFTILNFICGAQTLAKIPVHSALWDEPGVLIGRDQEEADIIIADDTVSRTHLRIVRISEQLVAEDMQSLAGTFLNGSKVQRTTDLLAMEFPLRFRLGEADLTLTIEHTE